MAALSERKIQIVRTLVEAAPDKVVDGLEAALAETSGDSALAAVRRLVDAEARDRRLRNLVLQPIAPLCVGDGRDPDRLVFPARVLGQLWRGLKVIAPGAVEEASFCVVDYRPLESSPEPFDELVRRAARAMRAGRVREFCTAAEICDEAKADGAATLIACLELAAIVRRATDCLPEWTGHITEEITFAARIAYRDAGAVAPDAGPRFFEMLGAQLPYPWMVLRVISAVMERPTERYLAESELAGFAERIMSDVDEALTSIARLDVDGGAPAAREAARRVELITLQVTELETCIDLTREQGWGHRIVEQKKKLAAVVEGRLREAEKYAALALPTGPAKLRRIRRSIPRLTLPPDERAVTRALTLLTFAREIRSSANYGGFAAARGRMLEKLGALLDHYVEEIVDLLKTGDVENEDRANAFVAIAAEFSGLVRDDKAADLVRRRAVAALSHPDRAAQPTAPLASVG
jgi:hypothetical protein